MGFLTLVQNWQGSVFLKFLLGTALPGTNSQQTCDNDFAAIWLSISMCTFALHLLTAVLFDS